MPEMQFRLIDLIDDMCAGKNVFFRFVSFAKDVMTDDVKALTLEDTIQTCLTLMINNNFRHVPVVDRPIGTEGKPYLLGVVSQRDIYRQISPYVAKLGETETEKRALRQPLTKILTRNPKYVSPETPMESVLISMIDNHIDMLPVVVEGNVEGVITASDIIKLFVQLGVIRQLCTKSKKRTRLDALTCWESHGAVTGSSSVLQTVQDIMTLELVWLKPEACLIDAIKIMQKRKCRHVPILNNQGQLMGIISDRDVLQYLSFPVVYPDAPKGKPRGFRTRLFASDPEDPSLHLRLSQILTPKVVHILPNCSIYEAAKILHKKRISCIPVVNGDGRLRGMVTTTDLMRALLVAYRATESCHV